MEGTLTICPKCCEEIEACFTLTFIDQEEKDSFLEQEYFRFVWQVTAFGDTVPNQQTETVQPSYFAPYIDGLTLTFCRNLPDTYQLADNVYTATVNMNGILGDVLIHFFDSEEVEFYIDCASKDIANELFAQGTKPQKKGCCTCEDAKKKAMEAWLALEAMEASFCCGNYEGVQQNIQLIKEL